MDTDNAAASLFSIFFGGQTTFSSEFFGNLELVKTHYSKWKIIDEVVKEHPDIFDNLDKISEKERSGRFSLFDKKKEEMELRDLHAQMKLMTKYVLEIDTWLSTRPNTIFDKDFDLGNKLDYVRRLCKVYRGGNTSKNDIYRAIGYLNSILEIFRREQRKEIHTMKNMKMDENKQRDIETKSKDADVEMECKKSKEEVTIEDVEEN